MHFHLTKLFILKSELHKENKRIKRQKERETKILHSSVQSSDGCQFWGESGHEAMSQGLLLTHVDGKRPTLGPSFTVFPRRNGSKMKYLEQEVAPSWLTPATLLHQP